ncbi:MAG: hypothetical protein IKP28_06200 [Clostridia bacterium]|nr:hypothetical protein [Clostridia bacterium]
MKKIEKEILTQGGCKIVAQFIDEALTNPLQRKAMMEYLISIRQEKVSELEIIEVANELMEIDI